jgi:hypothetical protein
VPSCLPVKTQKYRGGFDQASSGMQQLAQQSIAKENGAHRWHTVAGASSVMGG